MKKLNDDLNDYNFKYCILDYFEDFMKKNFSSLLTLCLVSHLLVTIIPVANAGDKSLSEIMAEHQNGLTLKGPTKAVEETINALYDNEIKLEELKDYFSEELSPKDYSKVSLLLDKNANLEEVTQEDLNQVLVNIGKGANFRGYVCSSFESKVIQFGSLIAFAVYATQAQDSKQRAELEELNLANQISIRNNTQGQIDHLLQSGVSENNDTIVQKKLEIFDINQRISSSPHLADALRLKSKTETKYAAVLAGTAVLSFGLCLHN